MIRVTCFGCKKELDVPGALLFSPPDEHNIVVKFHICTECFGHIVREDKSVDRDF